MADDEADVVADDGASKTTAMFIWPAPAKTAAAINMISPGTGTPTSWV